MSRPRFPQPPRVIRWRETFATVPYRGATVRRPVLVAITPHAIHFRLKRESVVHSLTYEAAFAYTVQLEARRAAAEAATIPKEARKA